MYQSKWTTYVDALRIYYDVVCVDCCSRESGYGFLVAGTGASAVVRHHQRALSITAVVWWDPDQIGTLCPVTLRKADGGAGSTWTLT